MLTRDDNHVYRWNGVQVPGVTSILEPLSMLGGISLEVLNKKSDLGRRVHLATELDDQDDLDESSIEDDVAPYLAAWRKFKAEKRVEILATEEFVFHPAHKYGGQLDRIIRMDASKFMLDIKTSVEVYMSAGPQTAAYLAAYRDPTVTRRCVVQLRPDGTYRFEELNDLMDWPVFLSCLTISSYKAKHANK
jgi:hypothetical protein